MPELANDAHERFAEEYLKDLNATQAYLRVYVEAAYETASTNGPELLRNTQVSARVSELKAERSARVRVSTDDVLRELMLIAFSDGNHYEVSDQGHLNPKEGIPPDVSRAVSSVTYKIYDNGEFTTREVTFKLWNKNDALKQLTDHLRNRLPREEDDETGEDGVFSIPLIRKAVRAAEERKRLAAGGGK